MATQKSQKENHTKKYLRLLYLVSFIEGGVVMVTEIAGAKLLTPFFGASLYSWAATLSITLLALMTGYYFGGYVTTKPKFSSGHNVFWLFLISGLMVFLMPTLGDYIMQKTIGLSFFAGIIISQLIFLLPPIFLMGMISPMIIFQITENALKSGRSAGNIYALSTFGGILFTLVFGFVIVPNFGISDPVRIIGLSVFLLGAGLLVFQKKFNLKKIAVVVVLGLIGAMFFGMNQTEASTPRTELLVKSEGLLGEIKIVDEFMKTPDGTPFYARRLKVNNIQQNYVIRDNPRVSLLYYVNFTRRLLEAMPQKESALLIGLGTGSLVHVLKYLNIKTESVEIDKRIYQYGRKYFNMPAHHHTITDGRYYINTTEKTYDLIIIDVAVGENIPEQLVSLECFQRCYELLSEDGILIVEHGGLSNIRNNLLIPSITKTLKAAGFMVTLYNPVQSYDVGDILFVASKKELEMLPRFPEGFLLKGGAFSDYELPLSVFNTEDAQLITDDKNNTDFMLKRHYFHIRENFRNNYSSKH